MTNATDSSASLAAPKVVVAKKVLVRASRPNEQRLRLALMGARPAQVRFLCEQMQLVPLAMRRIRIGRIAMGKLAPAHWRYLPAHERF